MLPGRTVFAALVVCSMFAPQFADAQARGAGARPDVQSDASAGVAPRLDPATLDRSIELGRRYLLGSQRADGSFVYEFDAPRGAPLPGRHAVREMGGLWALAVLHRARPTPETAAAITRAINLQDQHAKRTAAGGRYLCEPGAKEWTTNSVALYVLTLLDFLAGEHGLDAAAEAKCRRDLAETVTFLRSLRLPTGRFSAKYRVADGQGTAPPSPYADGEALLALVRAAKEDESDPTLRAAVVESAAAMYGEYVKHALRVDPDSPEARGFYQWGSMAFYELYTSEWPDTKAYAGRTIAMARWQIDVQTLLARTGNTGYAFEGLACAWELARLTNDAKNQQRIGDAIHGGLAKLVTWQIGSPVANSAAVPRSFAARPAMHGGIVNAPGDPRIRIDVVQHQVHAMLLARHLLFRPAESADGR